MTEIDFARIRADIRERLTGRTLQAVTNATGFHERTLAAVEEAGARDSRLRNLDREARALAAFAEYERIMQHMQATGADRYDPKKDTGAR